MAPIPPRSSGVVYHTSTQKDEDANAPGSWFELGYNGAKLKYTLEILGDTKQPTSGYPLYIGMHGGGGGAISGNNGQWNIMATQWYRNAVKAAMAKSGGSAVYVATRGVTLKDKQTDSWKLHFEAESYVLLEQMVMNLLSPTPQEIDKHPGSASIKNNLSNASSFVNPNQVYLLGFSAGGDGAFQFATRLSDRFAGVVAAAGHPGDARFANVANLSLCLQVGESDPYPRYPKPYKWMRAQAYLSVLWNELRPLRDGLKNAGFEDLYRCEGFIVKFKNYFGYADPSKDRDDAKHNEWSRSTTIDTNQDTLKSEKFEAAYEAYKTNSKTNSLTVPTFGSDGYRSVNLNPIAWLNKDAGRNPIVRNPIPTVVVWDLISRPDPVTTNPPEGWTEKRFFYWLFLRKPNDPELLKSLSGQSAPYVPERVSFNRGQSKITVLNPNGYLAFLIRADMFASNKISVWTGNTLLGTVDVTGSEIIKTQTLAARGDPNFVFDKIIYLEAKTAGSGWDVKTAGTLDIEGARL